MSKKRKQWKVPMRLTFDVTVTVEAESAEEARSQANETELVDDGMTCGCLTDWEVRGEPKEER